MDRGSRCPTWSATSTTCARSGPRPDAHWHDPDRPRRAEMVDAALDALVAVTLEAAGRPDPQEQFGARIGRAARRLRGQ